MLNHRPATLERGHVSKVRKRDGTGGCFGTESRDKGLCLHDILPKPRTEGADPLQPPSHEMRHIRRCRPNSVLTVLPIEIKRLIDKADPAECRGDENDPVIMGA